MNTTFWLLPVVSSVPAVLAPPQTKPVAPGDLPGSLVWGDCDGDGLADVLAVTAIGELHLLRNRGDGSFDDVTEDAGLAAVRAAGFGLWEDYDGDGEVDLFVGTQIGPSHLFRNRGGGLFEDVAATSGLIAEQRDRSARWLDYDADGRLDLHLVTDRGDHIYHALGDGLFERVDLDLPETAARTYGPLASARPESVGTAEKKETEAPPRGLLPRSAAPSRPRVPLDVSLRSLNDRLDAASDHVPPGGSIGLGPVVPPSGGPFACVESLVDQATGACLTAASSPTLGMLYPYPGLDNVFVPPAFVGGGQNNQATQPWSTVAGGRDNLASGKSTLPTIGEGYATVGGGGSNQALGPWSTIGGGQNNQALGHLSTVGGGGGDGYFTPFGNAASGAWGTIGGGGSNSASGGFATVAGGASNLAAGSQSTVGGGVGNATEAINATVGGGWTNTASGGAATVGGGRSNSASRTDATIGGGSGNAASADGATIAGGQDNAASGYNATVGGGLENDASGRRASVGGGYGNTASGVGATVGGGVANTADGARATIGGGYRNEASAGATVGGGRDNTAYGRFSAVPGGRLNSTRGDYSFAAGRLANADHAGAFVWGDSNLNSFRPKTSSRADEFNVYAGGGVRMFTNSEATTGVLLAPGGSTWTMVSDRHAKENIEPVDPRAVLDEVARLPLATWNYKAQDDSIRHMGPMAQDFYAAFGLGLGEKTIDTIDPGGVALAAIQGLNEVVKEKDAEIEELRARLERLEALARSATAK